MIARGFNYRALTPEIFKNKDNVTCTKFRLKVKSMNEQGVFNYLTFIIKGDIGLFHRQYITILRIDSVMVDTFKKKTVITVFGDVAPLND